MGDTAYHPLFENDEGWMNFFAILGRALHLAQHLEMNLRRIADISCTARSRMGLVSADIDSSEFHDELARMCQKRGGQLADYFSGRDGSPPSARAVFEGARDARHHLVHETTIGLEYGEDMDFDFYVFHILVLVEKIASADRIAATLIHAMNGDPPPDTEHWSTYVRRAMDWVRTGT
jgi:hypothetical protein